MKTTDIKKLSVASMLTAVAFLCTFIFRFKVAFLTFDFKDAVISTISFLYGPLYGVMSAGVTAFFEMLSMSDTGPYGMIMNFLSSGTFALTCGLLYKNKRTFSMAIVAVVASIFSVTSVMLLANIFITPHYMGSSTAEVIAFIPTLLLPFNLAKSIMNATVVLLIYKPVTNALRRVGLIKKSVQTNRAFSIKSILLIVVSIVIFIITTLFIINTLGGTFELFRS